MRAGLAGGGLMKAAVYRTYGAPDVVEICDIPMPEPGPGDLLIRVVASTVSSADWRARSLTTPPGFGPISRLAFGITGPREPVLGTGFSGVVERVGRDVTTFAPGDAVMGFPGAGVGCHAEFKVMPAAGKVVAKPQNLSFEAAASLFFGGTTALHFIQTKGCVQPGERVLILGASGALGSAAVQLARHLGAHVTGVCSTGNLELVQSLGASDVIDYTQTRVSDISARFDVVFDTVRALDVRPAMALLTPHGRLLSAVQSLGELLWMPVINMTGRQKVIGGIAAETLDSLRYLTELAQTGVITPVIDRVYPLDQIREAHAYVETGHKRGNVVISIG